jgi:hypothetical protein
LLIWIFHHFDVSVVYIFTIFIRILKKIRTKRGRRCCECAQDEVY